jgi:carboxylesterase
MPQPKYLDPSAYAAEGGPVGILLIHGFTGSVAETRPMGEYLAARGLAVRCPLLPGHGTTAQELTRIRWQAWAEEAESALRDLQGPCQTVFVGGLSLGSLLTLWLGANHPEIKGLIPMAPAIKVQNRLMPLTLGLRYLFKYNPFGGIGDADLGDPEAIERIWCYDDLPMWGAAEVYRLQRWVYQALPSIRQPVLIFQGRRDAQLDPQAAQILYDRVGSTNKTLVWLENSGHNLLADGEREAAWAQSYEWMMGVSGAQDRVLDAGYWPRHGR